MSCVGSNVGSALIDANTRNPGNRVLQLNCGQLATELTNEQCSFWHFRFAGSAEMRAVARIKSLPASLKTVYLLNQDYLFGQSIRDDTKKFLAVYRPDIKIVGDEMIPLMQVEDFSPYITKIKASGAESLLTGNYGPDLALLIKAKQWRATHDFGFIAINSVTQFDMLVRAIDKAGSTDPLKVALALEGMEQKDMSGAVNSMRKDDHRCRRNPADHL